MALIAFICLVIASPVLAYTIDGNKVYIDDSKAYISAEPHTLHESGWVYFNILSKTYSGNVDVAFGFDIENVKPKKAERLNGGGTWVNIADKFDSVYWTHDGLAKWWYVKNVPMVAGTTYTIRVWMDIPISTTAISSKYGVALKASSQTLQQAKDSGNLYYLDPWFNSSWSNRKAVIVTTNGSSTPAWYQVKLNVSYASEMQSDFDDLRFTNSSDGALAYWIDRSATVNGSFSNVWVNLSDSISDPGSSTVYMYYGNSAASDSSSGDGTFIFFDDFSTAWNVPTKWTGDTSFGSVSDGILNFSAASSTNHIIVGNVFSATKDVAVRVRGKIPTGYRGAIGAGNAASSHYGAIFQETGAKIYSIDGVVNTGVASNWTRDAWKTWDILISGGVSTKAKEGGTELAGSPKTTNPPNDYLSAWLYTNGNTISVDWIFTRKYITNEPNISFSSSESLPISSWGNSYTDNQTTTFSLLQNTIINFNVTSIYGDPVSWFFNGVDQSNSYNNISLNINNVGVNNITAIVTNESTETGSVSWFITLSTQLLTPVNGTTLYNPYPPAAPQITFTWSGAGYPFYQLYISTDPYFNYIVSSTYHSSDTANIYLLSDDQYFWKIRTYEDALTPGDWSSVSSFNITANFSVSGKTSIAGIVYEKKDNGDLIPIQNANVYIHNEFLNWSSTVSTGVNGFYLFDNLTNATVYSLYAKSSGYEDSATEYITTIPGQQVTKNIMITKCISSFNCGFITQPVTFTVRNLFDDEFPGVTVTVYKGDELTAFDTGLTDSGGSITFMLNKDTKYRVTFEGGGIDEMITYYAYGSQTNYRIVVVSGFPDGGNRLEYINTNLSASTVNATHSNLSLVYSDLISSTTSISFYAINLTTGATCYSNSTSEQNVTLSCAVLSKGTYRYGFTAVSSVYGTIRQDRVHNFNAGTSANNPLYGKVDSTLLHWGSIMLLVFVGAMFSIKTYKFGAILVPAMALVLWSMQWLQVNFLLLATAMCIGVMTYMRMSEHKVEY